MSQENVEKVLRSYSAWNRRDFDAVLEIGDPEIEWTMFGTTRFPGTDGTYHGHDGVREFWRVFIEPWEEFRIETSKPQPVLSIRASRLAPRLSADPKASSTTAWME
jgi:ketosteroid isomerase-like protein